MEKLLEKIAMNEVEESVSRILRSFQVRAIVKT